MAEGTVVLPPDSTGKALRTMTGGQYQPASTHQQVGTVAGPDGAMSSVFPAGFQRVSDEPSQVFYDPFDGALDTTIRWLPAVAAGGGVAGAVSAGQMTIGSGTTANGYSYVESRPTFMPTIPAWLGVSFALSVETPVLANANRFWGIGTSPGTPTAAAPLTNAVGFELATDGKLYAVVYSNGTRTAVQDFSAATGNAKQPTDALGHRYIVYYRTDRTYWYIDSLETPAATASFISPQVQVLPVKMHSIAGSTGPSSSAVLTIMGLAVWDTGKNNSTISDGTHPFRKAIVDAAGNLNVILGEASTSASTRVAAAAADTQLLAANTARRGMLVFNDSSAIMYLKYGTGAAFTSTGAAGNSFTVRIGSNSYWEMPNPVYAGQVNAIWASATGGAMITELT